MSLGEYLGAGAAITLDLQKMEGNSADTSGNAVAWTDANMAYGLAYGRFRQGAYFNNTPNSRIYAAGILVSGLAAFTILAWFKTSNTTAANRTIYGEGNSSTATAYTWVVFDSAQKLNYACHDDTTHGFVIATVNSYNDGLWHCVCAVKVSASSHFLIIDGGKEILSNSTNISGTTSVNQKSVGSINSGGVGSYFNNGCIDEIVLENVAWSQQKIQKYYTSAMGRFASL
jgi:hypothetical protein